MRANFLTTAPAAVRSSATIGTLSRLETHVIIGYPRRLLTRTSSVRRSAASKISSTATTSVARMAVAAQTRIFRNVILIPVILSNVATITVAFTPIDAWRKKMGLILIQTAARVLLPVLALQTSALSFVVPRTVHTITFALQSEPDIRNGNVLQRTGRSLVAVTINPRRI